MLIVKLICLVLGTALTALFILFALRGRKEDWRIEGVPQKEFSDKELWAAGFAMQQLPVFSMDSAVGKKMMSASAILHPENGGRFVEYWARLYWARTLSMSDTSIRTAMALDPSARSCAASSSTSRPRAHRATAAPCVTKVRAMPSPMPLEAPVIRAAFPLSFPIMSAPFLIVC